MAGFRKIYIDSSSDKTYSDQIVEQYIRAIQTGTLLVGAKLPSIRDLSLTLKINKIGVITAYNKLCDGGYIKAKAGSGYYVIYKPQKKYERISDKTVTSLNQDPQISVQDFSYQPLFYYTNESITNLGGNEIPKNLGIMEDLRGITRSIFSNNSIIYQNPNRQGFLPLREFIAFELENKGMPIFNAEQVLICNGAIQALNIVLNTYLSPNDYIVIEAPNFEFYFSSFILKKYQHIYLERTPEKINLCEAIKSEIKNKKPKIFILYSNCHNPTSGILSSVERHEIINLAKEVNAIIIEMDIYKGLNYDDFVPPYLSAMDGFNHTIYISSYSKIFAPGLRIGYLASNNEKIQRLILMKTFHEITSSLIDQQIIYEMCIRGILKKHIHKLKDSYRSKRDTLISMLKKTSPQGSKWNHPEAGMHLWFEFPHGEDLKVIEERSFEKKIAIAPGYYFFPNKINCNFMRINFANLEPVQTYNSLETIFTIWRNASSRKWIHKK